MRVLIEAATARIAEQASIISASNQIVLLCLISMEALWHSSLGSEEEAKFQQWSGVVAEVRRKRLSKVNVIKSIV